MEGAIHLDVPCPKIWGSSVESLKRGRWGFDLKRHLPATPCVCVDKPCSGFLSVIIKTPDRKHRKGRVTPVPNSSTVCHCMDAKVSGISNCQPHHIHSWGLREMWACMLSVQLAFPTLLQGSTQNQGDGFRLGLPTSTKVIKVIPYRCAQVGLTWCRYSGWSSLV